MHKDIKLSRELQDSFAAAVSHAKVVVLLLMLLLL